MYPYRGFFIILTEYCIIYVIKSSFSCESLVYNHEWIIQYIKDILMKRD